MGDKERLNIIIKKYNLILKPILGNSCEGCMFCMSENVNRFRQYCNSAASVLCNTHHKEGSRNYFIFVKKPLKDILSKL